MEDANIREVNRGQIKRQYFLPSGLKIHYREDISVPLLSSMDSQSIYIYILYNTQPGLVGFSL